MKLQPHYLTECNSFSSSITTIRFKQIFKQLTSLTAPVFVGKNGRSDTLKGKGGKMCVGLTLVNKKND
jgi:hypothetical protein